MSSAEEAIVYYTFSISDSNFILENLDQVLLPDQFMRNVSDFGQGTTLNIKTVGDVTLQQGGEDTDPVYQRMDSGNITLTIDQYPQAAWYISDELREDGSQIDQLHQSHASQALRAIGEFHESTYLAALNTAQTAADTNAIDGIAHRKVASGAGQILALQDFIDMALSFDQLGIPSEGRVAVITPRAAASMNAVIAAQAYVASPFLEGLLSTSIVNRMQFKGNLFGFNVFVSPRLPSVGSETVDSVAVANGKANMFMSIIDDQHKPLMGAWRRMPTVKTEYDMDKGADKFLLNARFGVEAQRVDTLSIVLTDDSTN